MAVEVNRIVFYIYFATGHVFATPEVLIGKGDTLKIEITDPTDLDERDVIRIVARTKVSKLLKDTYVEQEVSLYDPYTIIFECKYDYWTRQLRRAAARSGEDLEKNNA